MAIFDVANMRLEYTLQLCTLAEHAFSQPTLDFGFCTRLQKSARNMKIFVAILCLYLVVVVSSTATWKKLNSHKVCYGAKGNSVGVFRATKTVKAYQIKIERVSGSLSCDGRHYGYFRCGKHAFGVHLTARYNRIIVPAAPIQYSYKPWYHLNGNQPNAKAIVLSTGLHPYTFYYYHQYFVWYGEDLFHKFENDNAGRMCVNIYALA
eukprot:gene9996-11017_t